MSASSVRSIQQVVARLMAQHGSPYVEAPGPDDIVLPEMSPIWSDAERTSVEVVRQSDNRVPLTVRSREGHWVTIGGTPVCLPGGEGCDDPQAAANVTEMDNGLLTAERAREREAQFAQKYGPNVSQEVKRLAEDWYTMKPTSGADAWMQGSSVTSQTEKQAWDAVYRDTQEHLQNEVKGEAVVLYRGIPGQTVVDAVAHARATGSEYATIPLVDRPGAVPHGIMSFSSNERLAAQYAASRWVRHGGEPGVPGVVLTARVPKTAILFTTAHSAFTNPKAPDWNEYTVMVGKQQSIRVPLRDIKIVAGKQEAA